MFKHKHRKLLTNFPLPNFPSVSVKMREYESVVSLSSSLFKYTMAEFLDGTLFSILNNSFPSEPWTPKNSSSPSGSSPDNLKISFPTDEGPSLTITTISDPVEPGTGEKRGGTFGPAESTQVVLMRMMMMKK